MKTEVQIRTKDVPSQYLWMPNVVEERFGVRREEVGLHYSG